VASPPADPVGDSISVVDDCFNLFVMITSHDGASTLNVLQRLIIFNYYFFKFF
jgi:hypothetical protein